ncbi:PP2C family protein-serine/threonine phosphatase [Streptomyces sp. NPDC058001]|uniref:PP2C family protein-serine/threonine phosphatase n=1 Tax=Streptomyces sp. NPDC058001 TaxID=3346300 RepID=UPI0036E483F3
MERGTESVPRARPEAPPVPPRPSGDFVPGTFDPPADPAKEQRGPARHRRATPARGFVRSLPWLLIAGGLLFDALTPPQFTAAPLFAAAPLAAAPFYGLGATVIAGTLASLAVLGLRSFRGNVTHVEGFTEIVTIVTVAVLALLINTLVRRSDAQLASAREIAEAAQRAVLPVPAERIGGFDVAARYEAAQADAFIGGDLYAVQDTPHGVRVIVGDVRGKGMGAVAAVAVVIGAFREAAEQEGSLEAVAQRLERALEREGTRRRGIDDFEGFTTVLLAEIPHGEDIVRIVNRGHPEPLLLHADGGLRVLSPAQPALPLGMTDLGSWPDRADEAHFPYGATLLIYTDGLSEARDGEGIFYDPAERLRGRTFPGPGSLLTTVAREVREHTGGGSTDDMALIALRRP